MTNEHLWFPLCLPSLLGCMKITDAHTAGFRSEAMNSSCWGLCGKHFTRWAISPGLAWPFAAPISHYRVWFLIKFDLRVGTLCPPMSCHLTVCDKLKIVLSVSTYQRQSLNLSCPKWRLPRGKSSSILLINCKEKVSSKGQYLPSLAISSLPNHAKRARVTWNTTNLFNIWVYKPGGGGILL